MQTRNIVHQKKGRRENKISGKRNKKKRGRGEIVIEMQEKHLKKIWAAG